MVEKKKKRISPIKKNQYVEKLGELLLVLVTMVTILYRWKDNSQRQSKTVKDSQLRGVP